MTGREENFPPSNEETIREKWDEDFFSEKGKRGRKRERFVLRRRKRKGQPWDTGERGIMLGLEEKW